MTLLIIPLVAAVLGGTAPPGCESPFGAAHRERAAAPSLTGFPGLFEVPTAVSAVDKSTTMALNDIHTASVSGATVQRNAFVGFGILPRLTLVARGAWLTNAWNEGMRDISASAQLLLAHEGEWTPSIAIGAQDIGGRASNFETRYVTASKTLAGHVRLTAGVGQTGKYSLSGPFGGIEIALCRWVVAIAENAGTRHNYGVRLAPLGSWGADHGIEPTIDVLWREGQGRVIGAGLRFLPPVPRGAADRGGASAMPTAPPEYAALVPAEFVTLQDALVKHGFENVRVSRMGDTVAVAYENRVFNREEWDALGVVFGETARRAEGARVMRATILRVDLPVMEVVSDVAAFRGLVEGTLGTEAYARQLTVRYPAANTEGGVAANASRFHLDLTVRPRFETLVLTDISAAEVRTSLLPEATLQLGQGLALTARRAVVVHETSLFPDQVADPNADQLLLHAAHVGLPFGWSMPGVVSQVSVGRFGHNEVGGALASDVVLGDGRFSVGGVVAVFGERAAELRRSVALGSVRYRYAPLDLAASLTAGRFLHGDVGATAEVARRFGLMEVGIFAQATDIAKMAGARVAIPLTSARDPKPGPVRVRMPEYYDYDKRTQVLHATNDIRTDVAIPLETGMDLPRVFRGRDRLNAVSLSNEIETLRAAALRWVRP